MDSSTTKLVLVLGGTSYVAQFVLEHFMQLQLQSKKFSIAVTLRGSKEKLLDQVESLEKRHFLSSNVAVYEHVNFAEADQVIQCVQLFRPDYIINCIAMSSPAACEKDPVRGECINHPATLINELLKLKIRSKSNGPMTFIHFSTDFVYSGIDTPPKGYREQDATCPSCGTQYGKTKLAFDGFLLNAASSACADSADYFRARILRIANVIGPRAAFFDKSTPPKFMEWLTNQLLNVESDSKKQVTLWNDEIRSFLYVRDLSRLIDHLLTAEIKDPALLFNVGGIDALSRVELAERFVRLYNAKAGAEAIDFDAQVIPKSRAQVDLGYAPPLNAALDCSALEMTLDDFHFTPTDEYIAAIIDQDLLNTKSSSQPDL